ncbi:LacI family DNA-binding transcriptional regulator [Polycladomyces sp. WAk]|uniref:LacI family DNA-binding transcriptional regulator n=1 Tax=Polycladomyces zharkentensis TaxID=2807616 RepID=A0ABS2WMI3_9BACL|nr:LacI family DNA-binding transcriptional regulator [Polycladomyces sp. WAk]MBN2910722.1 LacI family DNA-binding transcriptional regulator [Polycladomyces sp. WAk]
MKKNIDDIAALAGVAKSTVSRYLNGGYVSEATKRKIKKVIEETNYEPNAFAQSLKAKKTNFIGVIAPRLDSYATSKTLIGIDEELKRQNHNLFIANTGQNVEREWEYLYSFAKQKVAGIILIATEMTEKHEEIIKNIQLPVLIVGQQSESFHSLIHDDYQAGWVIGNYVKEKGHKRIAYLGVTERDIAVGVKRKKGFSQAVGRGKPVEVRYYETSFSMEEAIEKAKQILDEYHPTVIVCATDNIAFGAMKAISLKGLSIPGDVSVTGFGGYNISRVIHPSLTTIRFAYKQTGEMAAASIIKMINGGDVPRLQVSHFNFDEGDSVRTL